uniref:Uncharacterized protein LOC116950524 n=1 Tax=Petromyzon marinus TaxID=7757 RepID=A0AAJ7TWH2_PETMA|nr:uncharacterized protein LOC116950524 [Petromyzon marinus]
MAGPPARTDLLENLEVSERDLEEDLRYSEPRRLALDVLVERGEVPYRQFLEREGIADFLSRGEVEHIRRHLLVPPAAEAASVESAVVANGADDGADNGGGDRSGSSGGGTYWPTVSDVVVPDLELGWPSPSNAGGPCRGQTNVTLYAQPPLGEGVPTIKQVVRRMLWQATQVIAIVMDVFSDVDIFRDLMDVACVRKVPVYIVLDNIGFPTFRNMCDCCGVNAGNIENMRVRVIKGTVHCCRTGKKFHGQMLEKFLLVDCRVALCGSYSFTWSYEKINRSIVQVFTGQVVEIFDEEFRILYGQSETPDSSCSPSRGIAQQRDIWDHRFQLDGKTQDARAWAFARNSSSHGLRNSYSSIKGGGFSKDRTANPSVASGDKDLLMMSYDEVHARKKWLQKQQRDSGTPDKPPVLFRNQNASGALQSRSSTCNAWKRHSYAGELMESSSSFQASNMFFESRDQGSIRPTGRCQDSTAAKMCGPARYGSVRFLDVESQKFRGPELFLQRQASLLCEGSQEGSMTNSEQESCKFTTHHNSEKFSKLSSSSREVKVGSQFLSSGGKPEGNTPGRLYAMPPQFHEQRRSNGEHANTGATGRQGMATKVNSDHKLRANRYFDKNSCNEEGNTSDVKGDDVNYPGKLDRSPRITAEAKTTREIINIKSKFKFARNLWFQASLPLSSMYKRESAINKYDATVDRVHVERFPKYVSQVSLKQGRNSEITNDESETHSSEQPLLFSRFRTAPKDQVKETVRSSLPILSATGGQDHLQLNRHQTTSMNNLQSKEATGDCRNGMPAERSGELSLRTLSMPSFMETGPQGLPQGATMKMSSLCKEGEKDESAMAKLKRSPEFRSLFYFSPDKGYEHFLNEAAQRIDDARSDELAGRQAESSIPKNTKLLEKSKVNALPYAASPSKYEHIPTSFTLASAETKSSALLENFSPDVSTNCLVDTKNSNMAPLPSPRLNAGSKLTKRPSEVRPESNYLGGACHRESISGALDEVAPTAADLTPNDVDLTHTKAQELTPRAVEPGDKEVDPDTAKPEDVNKSIDLRSQELLQKIDCMRREKRPYSRFEVFYKTDEDDAGKGLAAEAPAVPDTRPVWQSRFDVDLGRGGAQASLADYNRLSRHGSLSNLNSSFRTDGGFGGPGGGHRTTTMKRLTPQQLQQQQQQRHVHTNHLTGDRQKEERRLPKLMQRFVVTFKAKKK